MALKAMVDRINEPLWQDFDYFKGDILEYSELSRFIIKVHNQSKLWIWIVYYLLMNPFWFINIF